MKSFIGWIGGKSHLKIKLFLLFPIIALATLKYAAVQVGYSLVKIRLKSKWKSLMILMAI